MSRFNKNSKIIRYTTLLGEKRLALYRNKNDKNDFVDISESEFKQYIDEKRLAKFGLVAGGLSLALLMSNPLTLALTPVAGSIIFDKMWKDLKVKYGPNKNAKTLNNRTNKNDEKSSVCDTKELLKNIEEMFNK